MAVCATELSARSVGRRSLRALSVEVVVSIVIAPAVLWAAEPIPPDVRSYLERRRACEHFIGEEPFDEARRRFLELRILQTCSGINEQGQATRELHIASPQILKLLEPHTEPIVLAK